MMSRTSQMGRIVNVEGASRLRANHDDKGHGGQEFSQLLKQESDRLNQAETKGVENAGAVDLVETKLEGKMNIYTNQGIVNYFRMMTSMTDLRG
ncbi:MAG: hypothetical protein IJV71_07445 [Lachnospiraceae bacterium]|nr:hypothetical protein [Lachnospiraceae bacterium]